MTINVQQAIARVLTAAGYSDLFGTDPDQLRCHYRRFVKLLHPDVQHEPDAAEAFKRLARLHDQAQQALRLGTYGVPGPLTTISTKRGDYRLMKLAGTDSLCDIYVTETAAGPAVTKLARRLGDKDLLQAEAAAIRRLRGPDSDPKRHPYIPELLDSFAYREARKPTRQANVLVRPAGFVDLTQVRRAYPAGIQVLDMAWMWRRLLLVLGYAHRLDVVHGAVLPQHVTILPAQHGLMLTNWYYASLADDGVHRPIKAVVEGLQPWYPSEVLAKRPPSAATDIAMAVRCMIYLLGGDPVSAALPGTVPPAFRAFFKGCLSDRQVSRPDDAWKLLQEFDELLEHLGPPYFPRRFRPFAMPTGVA